MFGAKESISIVLTFINQATKPMEEAAGHVRTTVGKIKGFLSNLASHARWASMFIGAILVKHLKSAVEMAAEFEMFSVAAEYLTGSAEAADEFAQAIRKLSKESLFGVDAIAELGKYIVGNTRDVKKSERVLWVMIEAVTATNGGIEELRGATRAWIQTNVKAKASAEELNRQFSNANIPVMRTLGEAITENAEHPLRDYIEVSGVAKEGTEEWNESVKNIIGQLQNVGDLDIPGSIMADAILDALERAYGGASQELIRSFTGQTERLGDQLRFAGLRILGLDKNFRVLEGGVLDRLTGMVEKLNGFLEENQDAIDDWADSIAESTPILVGLATAILGILFPAFMGIIGNLILAAFLFGALGAAVGGLVKVYESNKSAFWGIITFLTLMGTIIFKMQIAAGLSGIASALMTVGSAALGLINPVTLIIVLVAALVAAGVYLIKNWDDISAMAKAYWDLIKVRVQGAIWAIERTIEEVWSGITDWLNNTWESIKDGAIEAWESVADSLIDTWGSTLEISKGYWGQIETTIGGAISRIKNETRGLAEESPAMFKEYWKLLITYVESGIWDIERPIRKLKGAILVLVQETYESIKQWLVDKWQVIIDNATNYVDNFVLFIDEAWQRLVHNTIETFFKLDQVIISWASGLPDTVATGFETGMTAARDSVKNKLVEIMIDFAEFASMFPTIIEGGFFLALTIATVGTQGLTVLFNGFLGALVVAFFYNIDQISNEWGEWIKFWMPRVTKSGLTLVKTIFKGNFEDIGTDLDGFIHDFRWAIDEFFWMLVRQTDLILNTMLQSFLRFFRQLLRVMRERLGGALNIFDINLEAILNRWIGWLNELEINLTGTVTWIMKKVRGLLDTIQNLITNFRPKISIGIDLPDVEGAWNSLKDRARNIGIPGFQHGGIVPGPPGTAVPIIAHAGERIVSRTGADVGGGMGSPVNINFSGPVYMDSEERVAELANRISQILGRQNELARYGAGF